MRINLSSYTTPNPHNHKYVSHVILDKEEIIKLERAIEALKYLQEQQTYGPGIYVSVSQETAEIVQSIVKPDSVEYTEN